MFGLIPFDANLIYRMDPKSSYLLEIKLACNPRTRREIYCFIISKVVDADICKFKDFVDEIEESILLDIKKLSLLLSMMW